MCGTSLRVPNSKAHPSRDTDRHENTLRHPSLRVNYLIRVFQTGCSCSFTLYVYYYVEQHRPLLYLSYVPIGIST